jgi:hypothetical protein
MTVKDRARALVITYESIPTAIKVVEDIREELLKQWNNIYPDEIIKFWCGTQECKYWTLVKQELESGHPATVGKAERWAKDYHVAPIDAGTSM